MNKTTKQLLTIILRLFSLGTKLGLTLYMGRYLSLEDFGSYGVVFSATTIITSLLGLRTDYVISRELVRASRQEAVRIMRDQALFLFLNWCFLSFVMACVIWGSWFGMPYAILIFILVLSIVENAADIVHVNLTSLGRPFFANCVFFVRSALWVFPVVLLGLLFPTLRSVGFVLSSWAFFAFIAVALSVFSWRSLPYHGLLFQSVHWSWILQSVRKSAGIWLGTVGLTTGAFLDRFIVLSVLGIASVGVATFYSSFSVALLALTHSGILSFAYPQMVALHGQGEYSKFWRKTRQTALSVFIFSSFFALALAVIVPVIGSLLGKDTFSQEAPTLWLLLLASWVRANSEPLYYVLFARHQDRAVWVGDLLFLIPSLGLNALLVPYYGLIGIGISALVASIFLFFWRGTFVLRNNRLSKKVHTITPETFLSQEIGSV